MQNRDNIAPLDGILVVDLSQFLSGPCASLRLADLGARVAKIEKPVKGDLCRQLYVSDVVLDGESTVFHAINRNKESFVADLKTPEGLELVKKLIRRADVVMHNFRPGVVERLGLAYESVRQLNPQVVYGQISGYGQEGPWRDHPGQDLLLQSLSGLAWLSGDAGQGPVPMGLSIADILCGMHLAQGILACLVRRSITGQGGLVDVSMLESVLDFQFETITTYFHDGGQPTQRTASNNAHAYLGAPYGVYRTRDGYLALAMGRVPQLGELLGCDPLRDYQDPATWFTERDRIKAILAHHLETEYHHPLAVHPRTRRHLVRRRTGLEAAASARRLQSARDVADGSPHQRNDLPTTRCPIRIDGERLYSAKGSPDLGEDTDRITRESIV